MAKIKKNTGSIGINIYNWIMVPNVWYDRIDDSIRFLIMIGLYFWAVLTFTYRWGMVLFALLGLYRIIYSMLARKEKMGARA